MKGVNFLPLSKKTFIKKPFSQYLYNPPHLQKKKMVQFFIDSADIEQIKKVKEFGLLDGVTTNPSLIKKAAQKHKVKDLESYIRQILKIAKGKPVSLEVIGNTYQDMVNEGITLFKRFNKIAKNVYIKIPVNPCLEESCSLASDGIKAIKTLTKKGIPINCTLIFTPEQALLAAKAGAKFVSPFLGREEDYLREMNRIKFKKEDYYPSKGFKKGKKVLNDNGIISGIDLLKECKAVLKNSKTKVLAASIRSTRMVRECAENGADIITIPFSVIQKLLNHKKTIEGMKKFKKDTIKEYARLTKKK